MINLKLFSWLYMYGLAFLTYCKRFGSPKSIRRHSTYLFFKWVFSIQKSTLKLKNFYFYFNLWNYCSFACWSNYTKFLWHLISVLQNVKIIIKTGELWTSDYGRRLTSWGRGFESRLCTYRSFVPKTIILDRNETWNLPLLHVGGWILRNGWLA